VCFVVLLFVAFVVLLFVAFVCIRANPNLLRECPRASSGPPYYCAPLVCVLDGLGFSGVAALQTNKQANKHVSTFTPLALGPEFASSWKVRGACGQFVIVHGSVCIVHELQTVLPILHRLAHRIKRWNRSLFCTTVGVGSQRVSTQRLPWEHPHTYIYLYIYINICIYRFICIYICTYM